MKEAHLKVYLMDTPLAQGDEYIASKYPHDGMFLLPNGFMYMRANNCVTYVGSPKSEFFTDVAKEPAPPAAAACSMNDMLKAIAISQNPDLALELCK